MQVSLSGWPVTLKGGEDNIFQRIAPAQTPVRGGEGLAPQREGREDVREKGIDSPKGRRKEKLIEDNIFLENPAQAPNSRGRASYLIREGHEGQRRGSTLKTLVKAPPGFHTD